MTDKVTDKSTKKTKPSRKISDAFVDSVKIGKRIMEIRKSKNLTQDYIMAKTGINIAQISSYENGDGISLPNIAKIAIALDVSIDQLVFGNIEDRPISLSKNRGELIANCVTALFDEQALVKTESPSFRGYPYDSGENSSISFGEFDFIVKDLLDRLSDLRINQDDIPDPELFKEQILATAANKINALDKEFAKKKEIPQKEKRKQQ